MTSKTNQEKQKHIKVEQQSQFQRDVNKLNAMPTHHTIVHSYYIYQLIVLHTHFKRQEIKYIVTPIGPNSMQPQYQQDT